MAKTARTAPATGLTTAAVRAIQALGGAPAGRADQIADRLAEAIRRGLIAPGERLPAEAALSEQFGVATLTLREALATLRERGLLVTRRGRSGGSFVAARTETRAAGGGAGASAGADSDNARSLTLKRPPSLLHATDAGLSALTLRRLSELGDLRRATYATAASLAAQRATALEVDALVRRVERLASARTPGERRSADGEFAVELAAAAQSPRLTQDEANLRAELGDLVWSLLSDAEHGEAVGARRRLVTAVARGSAAAAGRLAERQVAQETELLLRQRIDLYREEARRGHHRWSALARDVEHVFKDLQATAEAFATSYAEADAGGRGCTLADLATLRPRIHATLDAFQGLAVGTGIVVAPGVVADAAYWLEWWWRRGQGGGAPEALRVNLDPDGPDFFDYVNNEWFDVPVTSRRRHVAGPYVDYPCTNQYTFTLSVPVYHAGRPLGVAAMDVPCDQLEHRMMLALCADPTPRALLNPHGRLIASATGPRPATPTPAATAAAATAVPSALARLCALTGWTVVTLPETRAIS